VTFRLLAPMRDP